MPVAEFASPGQHQDARPDGIWSPCRARARSAALYSGDALHHRRCCPDARAHVVFFRGIHLPHRACPIELRYVSVLGFYVATRPIKYSKIVGTVGFEPTKPLACKASALPLSYAPVLVPAPAGGGIPARVPVPRRWVVRRYVTSAGVSAKHLGARPLASSLEKRSSSPRA